MSASAARTQVLVADDHPVFREGLARAIRERPELELVAEAGDGRAALAAIGEHIPDVAVLDLKMPELDGTAVVEALVRDGSPVRVVLLSAFHDSATVFRALEAGAAAYLTKDASRAAICDAVSAVARGETVLSPEAQDGVAKEVRVRAQDHRPALSEREREILALTAEGLSAPDIAKRLYLSPTTVKTHLQHVYDKLGVSDRAAAVAEAMRHRLLE